MAGDDNSSRFPAARPVALGIVGLVFILFGALLLGQAFSSATFGRLVTHAWMAGVAGLVFLIPGSAVVGFAIQCAFDSKNRCRSANDKNTNGGN